MPLWDSVPGNLHAFDSRKPEETHKSSPRESLFRKFDQKVFELLGPIPSTCMPFPGRLHFCSPSLLAGGWGASEPVDVCESWWWFTKTAFCSLGGIWGSREGEHQAHLHLLFTEGYFITNGLRYPGFSFSGLHKYYQFFHLYLRLLAKQRALAVV